MRIATAVLPRVFIVISLFALLFLAPLHAQDAVSGNWNRFSTDVAIERYEVNSEGQKTLAMSPAMTYRLEKIEERGHWRTVMTLLAADRPVVRVGSGTRQIDPYSVTRLEDPGDGSPFQITTAEGRKLARMPTQALEKGAASLQAALPGLSSLLLGNASARRAPAPTVGRDWLEGYVATPGKAAARLKKLEAQYGKPTSYYQGFAQHIAHAGPDRLEVLVDPQSGVIVGTNRSRNGVLLDHTTTHYVEGFGNAWVKSHFHAESLMPNGKRAVTNITYSNVTLDKRENRQ